MGVTELRIRSVYDNTILQTYTLRVGGPLSGLNVQVTEPKAGVPLYDVCPQGDSTVSVGYYSWNPSDTYFVCGQSYTVAVGLYPAQEYRFDSNTIFTINGRAATIELLEDDYVRLTYQFAPVAHELQYQQKVAETCTTDGSKAHYVCSECGKLFWNAAGTKEITDVSELVIPASHKYSNAIDAECNVCGEIRIIPADVENIFSDVQGNAWYVQYVQFAFDERIMIGKGVYTFGIGENMSRAEFVQALYNYEGKPEVTYQEHFTDVDQDAWYADAVTWAYNNNIASGYPGGAFGVEDEIDRQQLVQLLYKYAQWKQMDMMTNDSAMDEFSDGNKAAGWAKDALNWAITQGVMSGKGKSDGTVAIDPEGFATREQCATMLKNLLVP